MENVTINHLRIVCDSLINNCLNEKNGSKLERLFVIKKMIADDNVFEKIDSEIAMNILEDLMFKKKDIVKVYSMLIKKEI